LCRRAKTGLIFISVDKDIFVALKHSDLSFLKFWQYPSPLSNLFRLIMQQPHLPVATITPIKK
jgi:hypothetical protein